MNYLMLSVGRRAELMKYFKSSIKPGSQIIATDNSQYAPALYFADKYYIVPRIDDPSYIDIIIDICLKNNIRAVTTFIDPEIMLLAENRERFSEIGVEVLAPYKDTARVCFDKYEMFKFLSEKKIRTAKTWGSYEETLRALKNGDAEFPLFVKPRRGSGSVGARRIDDVVGLEVAFDQDSSLIAQELMDGVDLDADVYVDTVSHKAVSVFAKKKISTTIGGANKTISFKDERLFRFVEDIVSQFNFNGPIDMDFFYRSGEYFLSEVNPRFGGAYLHAYGAGVDFIKLIERNLEGFENDSIIGQYEENVVMMMYDSVVIRKASEK